MGIFLRLLLLTAFIGLGFWIISEAEAEARLENPDKSKVVVLFGFTVVDGIAIAAIVTLMIVPAIGQSIGALLFTPGGKIEHDAHADAIAKLAQGDPEGAIEDYQSILEKGPFRYARVERDRANLLPRSRRHRPGRHRH